MYNWQIMLLLRHLYCLRCAEVCKQQPALSSCSYCYTCCSAMLMFSHVGGVELVQLWMKCRGSFAAKAHADGAGTAAAELPDSHLQGLHRMGT